VFINKDLVEDTTWVTLTAAIWLTLVTVVVTKGIKHASYTQIVLTAIETCIIFALIIVAFYQFGGQPQHEYGRIFAGFSLFSFSPHDFATGALTAIFFYWGWDVTMNLSEETKQGAADEIQPAGKGAFWAMLNLI
jgi:amino acid transporter